MNESERKQPGEAVRRVRELIDEAQDRLRSDHEQIGERLSLGLDFEHYRTKDTSQAPDRIMPRDPAIFDIWRYKSALVLKRFPISVRCRPVDDEAGDYSNEAADEVKDALEDWLGNNRNRYKQTRRRYVGGAVAGGAWGARLDYDPERRTAVVRPVDGRNILLPDGILDPHDPDCEWCIIIERTPTERVRRQGRWEGADKAMPDSGYEVPGSTDNAYLKPGQVDLSNTGPDQSIIHPSAQTTIAYCYYRNSYKRKRKKGEGEVPEGEQRLFCLECGFTSPPQREMLEPLPLASLCPHCGGLAELSINPITEQAAYPDGRLVICAPLDNSQTEPYYDDKWPVPWPTYPVLWLTPYTFPHRVIPQSDVSVHKTGVLASNALVRLTYNQALKSRPLMAAPALGTFLNARGGNWTGKFEDGDILFASKAGPPPPISFYQGSQPNNSVFALYDRLQGRMRESQGTSQISVDPQQSKDIPVGTVKTLTETGNVPLDDLGQLVYDAESPFFECIAETLRFAYVPARRIRYQMDDGRDGFKTVSGLRMPKVHVEVSAGANLDLVDVEKLNAYRALIGVPEGAPIPPAYRKGLARFLRVPHEVIRQIEQDEQEAQEKQMQDENQVMGRAQEIVRRRSMTQPPMPNGSAPQMQGVNNA